MICKNCKMYYQTTGRRYSNYCPKCGTYNLGLDRNYYFTNNCSYNFWTYLLLNINLIK